jgi:hypothetical protein
MNKLQLRLLLKCYETLVQVLLGCCRPVTQSPYSNYTTVTKPGTQAVQPSL